MKRKTIKRKSHRELPTREIAHEDDIEFARDETCHCCGQLELGALRLSSFPYGDTRPILNWLRSEGYSSCNFTVFPDLARHLIRALKYAGVRLTTFRWTNKASGNRLVTVVFKL